MIFNKKSYIIIAVLIVIIIVLIIYIDKIEDRKVKNEDKNSQNQYIALKDNDIVSYLSDKISIEEITYALYLERNYNIKIKDSLNRLKNGEDIINITRSQDEASSIVTIDEQYIKYSSCPDKNATCYKMEDFLPITVGMTEIQVSTVLGGRKYNKILNTNINWPEHVYELINGGEIWIVYSPVTESGEFLLSTMIYVNDDKRIIMLKG